MKRGTDASDLARPNGATASRPSRLTRQTVDIEIDLSSAERSAVSPTGTASTAETP